MCLFFYLIRIDDDSPLTRFLMSGAGIIGCVLMLLIILGSIRDPLRPVKLNPLIIWPMVLFGAGILAVSFMHNVGRGYQLFALALMFIYPCLYIVWSNRDDLGTLFEAVSLSFIISALPAYCRFIRFCLGGSLTTDSGRVSPGINYNVYGMFGMVCVIASLYQLSLEIKRKAYMVFILFSLGAGVSMVLMSESRASLLVICGAFICTAIFHLKQHRPDGGRETEKRRLIKVCLAMGSVLLVCMISTALISLDEARKESAQPQNDLEQVSEETPEEAPDVIERFDATDTDPDAYTSGRYTLWRWYYEHLSLTGNDPTDFDIQAETGKHDPRAHNSFLEYGFLLGVPVALLHLILELAAGILALKYLFSRKYTDPALLFSIMCIMMYACETMVEIALLPFYRQATLLFYISLAAIAPKHDPT